MSLIRLPINPLAIPSIALSFARQRELVKAYAERYDPDSGDSLSEYVSRIGLEVYPGHRRKLHGERANFRAALRGQIKQVQGAKRDR